jgi:hypothetical protein
VGTVYYNGVAQSATGNFGNYGQTQDLYIGKRGNNPFQFFNGKLTNIRITDIAVYSSDFVPTQLPTVIASHTKLLLRPTVDTIYGVDEGNLGLAVASAGATYSSDYPPVTNRYTVATAPNAVFTPGLLLVFTNDYPNAGTIPVGATAVISGTLVTVVQVDINQDFAGHPAVYIATDAAGAVGSNVSVTFTWYT